MHRPFLLQGTVAPISLLLGLLVICTITHGFFVPYLPSSSLSSSASAMSVVSGLSVGKAVPRLGSSQLWAEVAEKSEGVSDVTERVITVSDSALKHLEDLRAKQGVEHLYLRMGVRSGGCSGMSYVLDVMKPEEVTEEDHVESYSEHHFSCVVDPKSLLYLFGLRLDFKDQLIGGGFAFLNPNAQESCGCGSSFGV
ncbi:iron-sulfur cluster assembly accessory protein [Nannochloropsis gaditana]|uniref:Iron-sulfur cluster assembly accessory protein n=1 Tax=Nannochloropsis gaditana TaxID=72520 RepID=W7T490_9STRA|nr:iron-sulfur cluster assembly accessory protein [Nannochloropsis gaditana]